MAVEISKSILNSCGEFIGQLIADSQAIETKINNCDYDLCDLVDSELINYMIAGVFVVVSNLDLKFQIIPRNNTFFVDLKSSKKQIEFSELNEKMTNSFKTLREIQIKDMKTNHDMTFKNEYYEYVGALLYLYYFYGIKVLGSFIGINFDGKASAKITIDAQSDNILIKEELEDLRRYISTINQQLKNLIKLKEKIDVTYIRIEILKIRESKNNILLSINDNTSKTNEEEELRYIEQRLNYFDTELIKTRNEMRIAEESLNENLQSYIKEYLGVDYGNDKNDNNNIEKN